MTCIYDKWPTRWSSVNTRSLPVVSSCYCRMLLLLEDVRGRRRRVLHNHNFLRSGKHRTQVVQRGFGGETTYQQQLIGPVCRPHCKQHELNDDGGETSHRWVTYVPSIRHLSVCHRGMMHHASALTLRSCNRLKFTLTRITNCSTSL